MTTSTREQRQAFLDKVKTIQTTPTILQQSGIGPDGKNYWDEWVDGNKIGLSLQKDRWLSEYSTTGLTQHLINSMLLYYSIKSIGYDSFDNEKKVYGDQLRGYVARAQAVYDMAAAEVSILQTEWAQEKDEAKKQVAWSRLQNEIATAIANADNLKTQKTTLAAALASGRAI